jgi:hypothetical protein
MKPKLMIDSLRIAKEIVPSTWSGRRYVVKREGTNLSVLIWGRKVLTGAADIARELLKSWELDDFGGVQGLEECLVEEKNLVLSILCDFVVCV